MEELIKRAFDDLTLAISAASDQYGRIAQTAKTIADCLIGGGAIFLCGNGGSAAEAQHFAAEFVGRFLMERPGLAAIALTTDTSKLTAIGNDYGFEETFARQIKALGRPGDVLWALSTSGVSPNVIKALATASESGLRTVFMCGISDPPEGAAEIIIKTPAAQTPRIQELHLLYGHVICQLVDSIIFENNYLKK
ncbi:MAG: SIS domain-containing protein [Deltaproteobacteria bacterium]|jgi:D-sedoheptulose 7-phosphate isomerase|nr:SIS domain-containing protein [Deltaproteobacteria bacterium]